MFEIGSIFPNRNGWRARIKVSGRIAEGPQRGTREEAQSDLDRARQCASRDEMQHFLKGLVVRQQQAHACEYEAHVCGTGLNDALGLGDEAVLASRGEHTQERVEIGSRANRGESTNPAAKKARVATVVAGSGGPRSAASSNRGDEFESSSSGVAQSAVAKQLPSYAGTATWSKCRRALWR